MKTRQNTIMGASVPKTAPPAGSGPQWAQDWAAAHPWPGTAELIPQLAAESDTCLLSFSCGKDAIATWLALRPHFKRIVPVYCYCVPDLKFIERGLLYFEDFFATPIVRMPHPALYKWLLSGYMLPPHRLPVIDALNLPVFDWDDVFTAVREDMGLPSDTLVMDGVRACDSIRRRTSIKKYGPVNRNRSLAHPIWDWNVAQVRAAIAEAGVELPIDYEWFGRSFDGLWGDFAVPLQRNAPEDWATMCEWFPLLPAVIAREKLIYGDWKEYGNA